MVVLWVILGVLLVITLLLCFPVHISFSYDVRRSKGKPVPELPETEPQPEPVLQDFPEETAETILARLLEEAERKNQPQPKPEKELQLVIRYLFFRFQLLPKKEETKKPKTKKEKPAKEPKRKEAAEKGESEGLSSILQLVRLALIKAKKPLGMVGRDILFYKLRLNMVVATEDAASTAVWYGKLNALVYGVLATVQNIVRIKDTKITIRPDFRGEPDRADVRGGFRVQFHPIIFLIAAPRFAIPFLVEFIRQKKEPAKEEQKTEDHSETAQQP